MVTAFMVVTAISISAIYFDFIELAGPGKIAQIDHGEIRSLFVLAGGIAVTVTLLVITFASGIFFCIIQPFVQKMQQQAETFHTLAKNAHESIFLIDINGIIKFMNPAAETMSGDTTEELLGENIKQLMPSPHREEQTTPDLAIIDLSLSGGSGLDLIERIKARNSETLMLVASMHDESLYAERVLAAGARGYINKQEAQEKIIKAIRQVLNGKVYLSEHMTERILNNIARGSDDKRDIDSLSNRELQVFEMIGHGIAPGKMAEQLNLSIKTIETYQAHIKKKLELSSSHKLTHRAIRWILEQGQ